MAEPFPKTIAHDTDAKAAGRSRETSKETRGTLAWRVIDIAVGAAVGVMSGVMF